MLEKRPPTIRIPRLQWFSVIASKNLQSILPEFQR